MGLIDRRLDAECPGTEMEPVASWSCTCPWMLAVLQTCRDFPWRKIHHVVLKMAFVFFEIRAVSASGQMTIPCSRSAGGIPHYQRHLQRGLGGRRPEASGSLEIAPGCSWVKDSKCPVWAERNRVRTGGREEQPGGLQVQRRLRREKTGKEGLGGHRLKRPGRRNRTGVWGTGDI